MCKITSKAECISDRLSVLAASCYIPSRIRDKKVNKNKNE